MRYLIFNITVLSALGYLFMASPDQSFTSWLGKAPQMFDAARSAGRDASATIDPSETAGTALLEAMEPVIEEVLSPPAQTAADLTGTSKQGPGHIAAEQLASHQTTPPVDNDNPPVTMRDIETMIRALLETRAEPDRAPDAVDAAKRQPDQTMDAGGTKAPLQSQPASVDAAPEPMTSELAATPPSPASVDAALEVAESGDTPGKPAPVISEQMSDADIAAAFSQLQQSAAGGDMAAIEQATAEQATADLATAPAAPTYMSPGQRADSLALMVEELQLMYLERTGG